MHEPSNEDQYFILCDNPGKQKKNVILINY